MLWVRSDYADSLAIACAWISAIVPWNITHTTEVVGGSLLFIRFPFFQLQFIYGLSIPGIDSPVIRNPLSAITYQSGRPLELVYQVWAIGAGFIALALALSVVIYLVPTPSEQQRIDPIPLMGFILSVAAVVLTIATYLLFTRGFGGVPIPVGVVILYAFGGILLGVERVERD